MVMLSTRFTGSSTSMTVVSWRSAASSAVSAPGRPKPSATKCGRRVVVDQPARLAAARSSPASAGRRTPLRTPRPRRPRHAGQRRIPVVAAEHLVGALAGLHHLDAGRDLLARAGRRRRSRGSPSARSSPRRRRRCPAAGASCRSGSGGGRCRTAWRPGRSTRTRRRLAAGGVEADAEGRRPAGRPRPAGRRSGWSRCRRTAARRPARRRPSGGRPRSRSVQQRLLPVLRRSSRRVSGRGLKSGCQ